MLCKAPTQGNDTTDHDMTCQCYSSCLVITDPFNVDCRIKSYTNSECHNPTYALPPHRLKISTGGDQKRL